MKPRHPAERHALSLCEPEGWESGIPLSSGPLGAVVWQSGKDLLISLDRPDLWDRRTIPEFQASSYTFDRFRSLVDADDMANLAKEFEEPYKRPAPTKLPTARLRIEGVGAPGEFRLDFHRAAATLEFGGARLEVAVLAGKHCLAIRTAGEPLPKPLIEAPRYGETPDGPLTGFMAMICAGKPEDLGYAPPTRFEAEGVEGFVQVTHDCAYAVGCVQAAGEGHALILAAVEIAHDPERAQAALIERLRELRQCNADLLLEQHADAWRKRWARSWIALPDDPRRERMWVLDTYLHLSSAAPDAPPVALQGPWTYDGGALPPWKGDYHHDLNTQMTYWPLYAANRLEESRAFVMWLWDTRDACREWTRRFYGRPGINVPMTADIGNRQLGGWAPYTHSLTTAAWLAQHMWWQWLHGRDRGLLEGIIAPWILEAATFLDAVIPVSDGQRRPPLSTSPEWNDNRREAFFSDWTSYDLSLTRYLFGIASEAAAELGNRAAARRWKEAEQSCPPLPVGDDGGIAIAEDCAFDRSHRHFSNALAIFPLGLLDPLVPQDRTLAEATIRNLRARGSDAWMGYTFGWMACLHAQLGQGDACLEELAIFDDGFRYPNGLHTNGDVSGKGYMKIPFNCFTLEGNSAALMAVQQMLVQSRANRIHLAPAIPAAWRRFEVHGFVSQCGVIVDHLRAQDGAIAARLRARAAFDGEIFIGQECRFSGFLEPGSSLTLSSS